MSNETTNVGLHTVSFGAEEKGVRDTDNGTYPKDIEPKEIAKTFEAEGALRIATEPNTKEQYPIYSAGMKNTERKAKKGTTARESR